MKKYLNGAAMLFINSVRNIKSGWSSFQNIHITEHELYVFTIHGLSGQSQDQLQDFYQTTNL